MSTPNHAGENMSWEFKEGVVELRLHRTPCNEIGSKSLDDLEAFSRYLQSLDQCLQMLRLADRHRHVKLGRIGGEGDAGIPRQSRRCTPRRHFRNHWRAVHRNVFPY